MGNINTYSKMSWQSQPLRNMLGLKQNILPSMLPRNSNEKAFLLRCPQAVFVFTYKLKLPHSHCKTIQ